MDSVANSWCHTQKKHTITAWDLNKRTTEIIRTSKNKKLINLVDKIKQHIQHEEYHVTTIG